MGTKCEKLRNVKDNEKRDSSRENIVMKKTTKGKAMSGSHQKMNTMMNVTEKLAARGSQVASYVLMLHLRNLQPGNHAQMKTHGITSAIIQQSGTFYSQMFVDTAVAPKP